MLHRIKTRLHGAIPLADNNMLMTSLSVSKLGP